MRGNEYSKKIADGIVLTTTETGRGYTISDDIARKITDKFPDFPDLVARVNYLEEGVESAYLILTFPELFSAKTTFSAECALRETYPDVYMEYAGRNEGLIKDNSWASNASPWGSIDYTLAVAPGITFIAAKYGKGYALSNAVWEKIVRSFPNLPHFVNTKQEDDIHYLENPIESAFLVLALPEYFDHETRESSEKMLKNVCPYDYMAFTNKPLTAAESRMLRKAAFDREHKDDFVAYEKLALSDSYLVYAKKRGLDERVEGCFIVPKERFDAPREFGYLIDEDDVPVSDVSLALSIVDMHGLRITGEELANAIATA